MFIQNISLADLTEVDLQKLAKVKVLMVGDGNNACGVIANLSLLNLGEVGVLNNPNIDKIVKALPKMYSVGDIRVYSTELWSEEIAQVLAKYDIVIDCLGDFGSKFVLNKLATGLQKPFVYCSMSKYNGQVTTIKAGETACLECLYPQGQLEEFDIDDDYELLSGAIAAIQVRAMIGYVIGDGEDLRNKLISYNSDSLSLNKITLMRNPECNVCASY